MNVARTSLRHYIGLGSRGVLALAFAVQLACTASTEAPEDPGVAGGDGTGGDPGAGGVGVGGDGGAVASGGMGGEIVMPGGSSGSGGASATGGATGGLPPGTIVEDFESYPEKTFGEGRGERLGTMWVLDVRNQSTLSIDSTKPYRGTKSMHIQAPSGPDRWATLYFGRPFFPASNNTIFGRAMIFLKQNPRAEVHWNYFTALGLYRDPVTQQSRQLEWNWGGHRSNIQAFYNENDCYRRSQLEGPEGKWVCWQWKFSGVPDANASGGQKRELFVWAYGQLAPVLAVRGAPEACAAGPVIPWMAPQFNQGYLGYIHAQPSPVPIEVWWDDLAMGPEMIPCPEGYTP